MTQYILFKPDLTVADIVSIFSALVALVYFYLYTKNIQIINGRKLFLEEYRAQISDVTSIIDEINSHEISTILEKMNKTSATLTEDEEALLKSVSDRASNTLDLVTNQLISVKEWKIFFKNIPDTDEMKLDIKANLQVQLIDLYLFLVKVVEYAKRTNSTILAHIELNLEYSEMISDKSPSEEVTENTNSNSKNLKKNSSDEENITVLMVALHKKNGNKSWLKQSLGNWKISKNRMNKIKYIVGINIATRNLVSLASVTTPKEIDDRIRFSIETNGIMAEQPYDDHEERSLKLISEATYWNARNPVRYLEMSMSKIKELEKALQNTDN